MKRVRTSLAALAAALALGLPPASAREAAPAPPKARVETLRFAPDPGIVPAVTERLDGARETLEVAIYSLTHPEIAAALVRAHKRGVRVRVLFDKVQAAGRYSQDERLERAGVPVRRDRERGLMHHKFAVIDRRTVMTGSFNYTRGAAERNRENLIVLEDAALAARYAAQFEEAWAASAPARRRRGAAAR